MENTLLWVTRNCILDSSSGGSMSVLDMLVNLKGAGWKITVLNSLVFDNPNGITKIGEDVYQRIRDSENYISRIDYDGIDFVVTKANSTELNKMTHEELTYWYDTFIDLLDMKLPDVVFMYGGAAIDFLISDEAKTRGIPVVAYLVNGNYHGVRWCRDISAIVTDTQATSNLYKNRKGYTPVPVGKFINRESVVATKNVRKSFVLINPSLAKGGALVARIAIYLEKVRPDIKIKVVASRGNWAAILEEVQDIEETPNRPLENITLVPNTDDIRTVYSDARALFVMSLWYESGARVIAEAMMNGIPIIATQNGGNQEMAEHGGIYLKLHEKYHAKPYTKVPTIAEMMPLINKIIELNDDETYYNEYCKRAYEVGRKFEPKESTKRLEAVLDGVIDKNVSKRFDLAQKSIHSFGDSINSYHFWANSASMVHYDLNKGERGVFIDCGGHDGCSVIKFYRENRHFDIVTFEPNKMFTDTYDQLPTTLIPKAVSDTDGTADFIVDQLDGDGSTLIPSKKVDFFGLKGNKEHNVEKVDTIDLSRFIHSLAQDYNKIILKLDVEGAEYQILQKMLDDQTLELIEALYAEFHWDKMADYPKEKHDKLVERVSEIITIKPWDALQYASLSEDRKKFLKLFPKGLKENKKDFSKYL